MTKKFFVQSLIKCRDCTEVALIILGATFVQADGKSAETSGAPPHAPRLREPALPGIGALASLAFQEHPICCPFTQSWKCTPGSICK